MTRMLFILNDPPYGTERSYNGFRLGRSLSIREDAQVKVFLMGDAVSCALAGQKTPDGYYNLERMIRATAERSRDWLLRHPVSTPAASQISSWLRAYAGPRWISSLSGRSGRIR